MLRAGAGVDLPGNNVDQAGRGSIDRQTGNHIDRRLGLFGFGDRLDSQFSGAAHDRDRSVENRRVADGERPRQNVQPGVGPASGDHLRADARDIAHCQTNPRATW